MPVTLLDLRAEQKNPFPSKKDSEGKPVSTCKTSGGKVVVRDPKTITGITVHQTACVFGPAADRAKAHRRALNIPAHAVAFRDGVFAIPAEPTWYLYHGNALNSFTLGLEIEGRYRGLVHDPKTLWGGDETPCDALTIDTAREALKWLVTTGRSLGMPIKDVYAHRQSNGQKPSDPGEALWKAVVLEYGVPVLGLTPQNKFTVEKGRPIPKQWDPNATANY